MRNYCRDRKLGINPIRVSLGSGSLLRLFRVHVLDLFHSVFKAFAFYCSLKGFYSYPDGNEVTYETLSSCIIWNPEIA